MVQGSAADIMKLALVLLHRAACQSRRGQGKVPPFQLVLQIHDEVLVECADDPHTVSLYVARVFSVG